MLDWLAPYGQTIALVAAIIAAFGVYLSNRHAENEADRHREELLAKNELLLERADDNARLQAELRTAAEETIRQVTGQGGYPIVVPYFTQISPEIVKREGRVIPDVIPTWFGILNNSSAPVVAPLVIISQLVPMGEGIMGSNSKEIFRGRIDNVYPGMGPTFLDVRSTITKAKDNWFDVFIISRAAKFSQRIVVTWDGEKWEMGYELLQHEDADNDVEEKIIQRIRNDFPFMDAPRPLRPSG